MPAKEARRNQALAEIDRFLGEFAAWKDMHAAERVRQSDDPRRQYDSQIQAVSDEVEGAACILRRDLADSIDLSEPAGSVYRKCAAIEHELLWLWRVWDYFREKFDQRLDATYRATLLAADEVVWSCYRPFFQTLAGGRVPQPAPLPYIDGDFSPSILRRDRREVLARRGPNFKLTLEAFQQLPVPILKIPITALCNPWSLVLVGHEIGHIVQPMFPDKFPERFATAIANAVPAQDAEYWQDWAPEIFADWHGVMTMGPWMLWAMSQFELADRAVMLERRGAYPSPLVRLGLIAAMVKAYGLSHAPVMSPSDLSLKITCDDPPEACRDANSINVVVAAIIAMPELRTYSERLLFKTNPYEMSSVSGVAGEIEQWSRHVVQGTPSPPKTRMYSARMAAAGVAHAWNEHVIGPDVPPSLAELEAWRIKAREVIASAAEQSVRSAMSARGTEKPQGATLIDFARRHSI